MNKLLVAVSLVAVGLSAWAETPDFFAEKLTSDGKGYVDTHYSYKRAAETSPKTSKVVLDYYDTDRCGYSNPYTSKTSRRTYFSFWKSDGKGLSHVNYSGTTAQIMGEDWKAVNPTPGTGDASVTLNYATGKGKWGGGEFDLPLVSEWDMSAAMSYYLFAWNYDGNAQSFGVFDLKNFRIYESADDGATETLVRDFVPCYANGRAGVYDRKTGVICPATSDGFYLTGYDIDLAADEALSVTPACASPRTLTLAAGSSLVFDGRATLAPEETAVLPASGTVAVSLNESTGRGRYVLLDNLPADYDLATFTLAATPAYTTGRLEKEGTALVLVLASTRPTPPEALCASVTGDGVNWFDTGYLYKGATNPRTKRMHMEFYASTDTLAGKAPGPVASGNTHAPFGFLEGTYCMSYFRTSYSAFQVWGDAYWFNGEATPKQSVSAKSGNLVLDIDYFTEVVKYGNAVVTNVPTSVTDAKACPVFMFASCGTSGSGDNLAVFDLKSFQIYETADGGATETLVRDFVPCVSGGSAAIYDRVTGAHVAPSSPEHSFTCADPCWRLTTGDDVGFNAVGTQLNLSGPADADGYAVIDDVSGEVLQKGLGRALALVMPAAAASVLWTKDESVDAGATRNVAGLVGCNTLTLGANAKLAFAADGKLVLSEGLSLPTDGKVFVSAAGLSLPGTYVLAIGVRESVRVAAFEVAEVADGLKGTVARIGEKLVLRLDEDATAAGAIAGRALTTDGSGWIDSGYHYKNSAEVKTTRIQFDFMTVNYGRAPGAAIAGNPSIFGYCNTSDGKRLSYCRYGGDSTGVQVWSGNNTKDWDNATFGARNGEQSIVLDFANAQVTWNGQSKTIYPSAVVLEERSYWLAGVNGNNTPSYMEIRHFQAWETTDGGATETLACDVVPAWKAGAVGAYDRVTKAFSVPNYKADPGPGFTVDLGDVAQEFAAVSTRCNGQLVALPAFAPQDELTFLADGTVRAKTAVESFVLTGYDAAGAVVSTTTVAPVEVGKAYGVTLGEAAKVVVKVVGASLGTVAQDFEKAGAVGDAESLERKVSKYEYEYMVAGAAMLTFKADVTSVVADLCDASGAKIGEETLAGAVDAGAPLAIAAHETAAYRIVHVSLRRPGALIFIR